MRYSVIIFFLFFFAQDIIAQVPGYRGKRLYINYECIPHLFLNDIQAVYDKQGQLIENNNNPVTIRFGHKGSINYVLSKKFILSSDLSYREDRLRFLGINYNTNTVYNLFLRTKNRSIGLSLKRMNYIGRQGHYIAPVGNFFEINTFWAQIKAEDYINPKAQSINNSFGVGAYWGMQTVWFHRLVPSYIIGLSYLFGDFNGRFEDLGNDPLEMEIRKKAFGGIVPGILFTGRVGIGILLF